MNQTSCLITCLLLCFFTGLAQPGSLDLTFSGDGKTTAGFLLPSTKTHDNIKSVAVQVDGKIVVAGSSISDDFHYYYFSVVRYNTTGVLDNTFHLDGKQTTPTGSYGGEAYAVAIQTDGKIVVAGYSENGNNSDFEIVRYNSNGTPDATFSGDGRQTTDFGGSESAQSIVIQADGKIIAAGYAYNGSNYDFAVVRYNSNGTLDNTFSEDGKLTSAIGSNDDKANSIVLQADGKIVAAGYSFNGSNYDFGAVRYNTNGTLDNTFSGDGKLTTAIGTGDEVAHSVAKQADGKIVVAGYSYNGSNNDFAVVRYNTDGTLDNSFSGDGRLTITIGNGDEVAHSVAIQKDGRLVIAGTAFNGFNNDFAVVRYNTDGTLDNSFGNDGKETTDAIGRPEIAYAVTLQGDGKIIAAGVSFESYVNDDIQLVRYNVNGTLDNNFAGDGIVSTEIGGLETAAVDNGQAVAVNANGKVIVVGSSSSSGAYAKEDIAIAQYNADGNLDNTFGFKGKVLGEIEGGSFTVKTAAIQQDGKTIVGGYFDNGKKNFALARYNANGSLDKTFSNDGFVTTSVSQNGIDRIWEVIVQPDGKILAAGNSKSCTDCASDFALVRYNANGTLDYFFSVDGKLTTDFAMGDDEARSLALQADGKIVITGHTYNGSDYNIAIARYLPNGDLDATFSADGKQTTDFGGNDDYGKSVEIQADGKILVGGNSGKVSVKDDDFVLVRYNVNGTLDISFSGDGKQRTTIDGTTADYCQSLTLQSDGKIIAGGYYLNSSGQYDFALVRYLTDGTADNTFGTNGKISTDFANSDDFAKSITIDANGKLLVAGYSNNDFAVARYNLTATTTIAKTAEVNKLMQPLAIEVYPNPFSSQAVISYTLETNAAVTIDLLDITGKKIRTIEKGVVDKGIHQVTLSRESLAPGVYFLRIIKGTEIITSKVVIE